MNNQTIHRPGSINEPTNLFIKSHDIVKIDLIITRILLININNKCHLYSSIY